MTADEITELARTAYQIVQRIDAMNAAFRQLSAERDELRLQLDKARSDRDEAIAAWSEAQAEALSAEAPSARLRRAAQIDALRDMRADVRRRPPSMDRDRIVEACEQRIDAMLRLLDDPARDGEDLTVEQIVEEATRYDCRVRICDQWVTVGGAIRMAQLEVRRAVASWLRSGPRISEVMGARGIGSADAVLEALADAVMGGAGGPA